MSLLDHVRTLVEAEQGLTEALEKSLPLLSHSSHHHHDNMLSSSQQSESPLLPTPRNAAEVPTILAVARAYSLRTSAPPMWNPNLPVIGFATPNPLPHQLRGGALGAMQLKMAREEKNRKGKELSDRREMERRKAEEEKKMLESIVECKNAKGEIPEDEMDVDNDSTTEANKRKREEELLDDPKKHEMLERQKRQQLATQQQQAQAAASNNVQVKRQTKEEYEKKKAAANMNLSDSSSSSEDEGSDDEESD